MYERASEKEEAVNSKGRQFRLISSDPENVSAHNKRKHKHYTRVSVPPNQSFISIYISLPNPNPLPQRLVGGKKQKKNSHCNSPFPLPQSPPPITQHPRSNRPQSCHSENSTDNQPRQNHRYNFKHNNSRHKCKCHDENGRFDFLAAARPTRRSNELRIRCLTRRRRQRR